MTYEELQKAYKNVSAELANAKVKIENQQIELNNLRRIVFGSRREYTPEVEQEDTMQCSLFKNEKEMDENVEKEVQERTNEKIGFKEILKLSNENIIIKEIIDNYFKYLCIGIENLINIYDPEVISIGGGIALNGEEFINNIRNKLNNKIKIQTAYLKENSGIYGAAMYAEKSINKI